MIASAQKCIELQRGRKDVWRFLFTGSKSLRAWKSADAAVQLVVQLAEATDNNNSKKKNI